MTAVGRSAKSAKARFSTRARQAETGGKRPLRIFARDLAVGRATIEQTRNTSSVRLRVDRLPRVGV